MIEYRQIQLPESEILNYLNENEAIFNPKLSLRLDIKAYSQKLHKYATHFCAYDNNRLIGLIACYFNDRINKSGFISSVSVIEEYHGLGITMDLLMLVINYGKLNNFNNIKLEVKSENISATSIYKKIGFVEIAQRNNIIAMELNLKTQ